MGEVADAVYKLSDFPTAGTRAGAGAEGLDGSTGLSEAGRRTDGSYTGTADGAADAGSQGTRGCKQAFCPAFETSSAAAADDSDDNGDDDDDAESACCCGSHFSFLPSQGQVSIIVFALVLI